MAEVIAKSEQDFKELKELLEECTKSFLECMRFYKFTPKKGKVEDAKPEEFFSIWYPFCDDYKNIHLEEGAGGIKFLYMLTLFECWVSAPDGRVRGPRFKSCITNTTTRFIVF